jgi:iron complex transport system ATP-binding protein
MLPLLKVSALHVRRGPATLLRRIDWRCEAGEHWAVLGPNGCGKTTLLKALTGYLSPSRGEISLLGRHYGACDWRELREQIGVVTSVFATAIPPAEPALDTVLSGKFAQLDLWHHTTARERAAARRQLKFVGLARLAERPWAFLSQGERQRVLIARALMARPRLLVLDEPCAGLDPVAREKFLRWLDRLARGRRAPGIVLVTHHVEEIVPAFTHALLLRAGQVVAAGPRDTVLTSPNLSQAFGAPLRLSRRDGRYRLAFPRS